MLHQPRRYRIEGTVLARYSPYQLVDFADCHVLERRQSRQHFEDGLLLISGGLADAVLARILSDFACKVTRLPVARLPLCAGTEKRWFN